MIKSKSDKLREECGVFGVSNTEDAATLVALGLHALQHRGQKGCRECYRSMEKIIIQKKSMDW